MATIIAKGCRPQALLLEAGNVGAILLYSDNLFFFSYLVARLDVSTAMDRYQMKQLVSLAFVASYFLLLVSLHVTVSEKVLVAADLVLKMDLQGCQTFDWMMSRFVPLLTSHKSIPQWQNAET